MPGEKDYNVMIDCETGGLYESQHCLLQVAAIIFHIEVHNKLFKLVEDDYYQSKIKPNKNLGITIGALEINKLDLDDLIENGKDECVVYKELIDFMEKYMGKDHNYMGRIWAHNDDFDAKFMSQFAKRCKSYSETNIFYPTNWNCTQHFFRELKFFGRHSEESCKLSSIMDYYNIQQAGTEHDAMSDAHNAILILEAMMNHLKLGEKVVKMSDCSN